MRLLCNGSKSDWHVNQSKKVGGRNFEEKICRVANSKVKYLPRKTKIDTDRRLKIDIFIVVLNTKCARVFYISNVIVLLLT